MSEDRTAGLPTDDITMLLPWYVTRRLVPGEALHIEAILSCNPPLMNHLAAIRSEKAAIAALNDDLGEPSPRTLLKLFAAIAAESGPTGRPPVSYRAG